MSLRGRTRSSCTVRGLAARPVLLACGNVHRQAISNGHFGHLNILAHVGTNFPPQSQLSVRWLVCVSHAKSLLKKTALFKEENVKVKRSSRWPYSHMHFIRAQPSRLAQQNFRLKLHTKKTESEKGYFLAVIAELYDKKTFVCVR